MILRRNYQAVFPSIHSSYQNCLLVPIQQQCASWGPRPPKFESCVEKAEFRRRYAETEEIWLTNSQTRGDNKQLGKVGFECSLRPSDF